MLVGFFTIIHKEEYHMNRSYIPLWHPVKARIPQKVLACLLVTVLGFITLVAPHTYVRAEEGAAEPVSLIAGQIPTRAYMAQRSNYAARATSGTFKLGNNAFGTTDSTNDDKFKTELEKLTDGVADGDTNKCLNITLYGGSNEVLRHPYTASPVGVLIYDLGREADVQEIRLTSAKPEKYIVAGYDCYVGQSIEDLAAFFAQDNQVYTSNGNQALADGSGKLDPATSLKAWETTVDLSGSVRRGRYVAVVITRPTDVSGVDYIARMAEIAVLGSFPTFKPDPQVTARTSDSLSLSWTAEASASAYKVYASANPFNEEIPVGMEPALSIEADGATSDTITGTIPGLAEKTAYYIAIIAEDSVGNVFAWFSEGTVSTTASNTSTGQLTITAEVGVSYTLSIPTSMGTITAAGDHKVGTLYASKLTLGDGDTLTVTASHEEELTHTNKTDKLAYALKAASYNSNELADYTPVTFTKNSTVGIDGGTDLYVSIAAADWNAAAAGTYTDTVTFQAAYTPGE